MIRNKELLTSQLKKLMTGSSQYFNIEQNKDKTVAAIYAILTLVTLSFFGIFAINPTISTIIELKKEFEENQDVLRQLETKVKSLNSLNVQYEQIKPDLTLLNDAMPDSPKIPQFVRKIEIIADKNNVSVEKLDTGLLELYPAKNVNSPIFSYTFTTTVNGNSANINKFLNEIVNIDRIVGIDRLSITSRDNNNSTDVAGRVFIYKP